MEKENIPKPLAQYIFYLESKLGGGFEGLMIGFEFEDLICSYTFNTYIILFVLYINIW